MFQRASCDEVKQCPQKTTYQEHARTRTHTQKKKKTREQAFSLSGLSLFARSSSNSGAEPPAGHTVKRARANQRSYSHQVNKTTPCQHLK